MDLWTGYWQWKLDEKSQDKTGFNTPFGNYCWKVAPMGFTNVPPAFQRLMWKVFEGYAGKFAEILIDDIIIYSSTFEEHLGHLELALQHLEESKLCLKAEKCQFATSKIVVWGYTVDGYGVSVDPHLANKLQAMQIPKNVGGVHTFLGLAGYYRRMIEDFAGIAACLTDLTKKDVKFQWDVEQQMAFEKLKEITTSDIVMKHPEPGKPFAI